MTGGCRKTALRKKDEKRPPKLNRIPSRGQGNKKKQGMDKKSLVTKEGCQRFSL